MNLKSRFKPRAEASLLSRLIQEAWGDYQGRIASAERQAEAAERISNYFETLIPAADFEVLSRYNCIAWHDHCNVRVYDAQTDDVSKYREAFGLELPRKVPVLGTGGHGYPSLAACEPNRKSPLPNLDPYFLTLLTARKQYKREYKASVSWPAEYAQEHNGQYPTWDEIAEKWPVLGEWLKTKANEATA